jgi:flagellar biosynthesis protein FlhB
MADESDDDEKTEEPTSYRIDEFRKKGDVAQSVEINHLLVLATTITVMIFSFGFMAEELMNYIEWLFQLSLKDIFTSDGGRRVTYQSFKVFLVVCSPIVIVAFLVALSSHLMQIGFLFSPDVLEFNLDRINPINGFKRIFSMKAIIELLKAVLKLSFISLVLYYFLKDNYQFFLGQLHVDLFSGLKSFESFGVKAIFKIFGVLLFVAGIDFTYQKLSYRKRLMMTKQELKKENKEQEGGPEVKQRMRALQRQMAQKRIVNDVKNADALVVNPTHISIAIKYDSEKMLAPIVSAKGADHLALKMREVALEHKIPIVENIALARSLYATVKSGHPVPRGLYKAVAEVLAFVYRRKKIRPKFKEKK